MSAMITAVVGGAVVGAYVAGEAGKSAADTQAAAARYAGNLEAMAQAEATEESRRQYDTAREDYGPWRAAGENALTQLMGWDATHPQAEGEDPLVRPEGAPTGILTDPMAQYEESDYNKFLQAEGVKALERGAASRGKQLGGAQQKALTRWGQNIAGAGYADWYNQKVNPLMSLAGLGQVATGGTAQAGATSATQIQSALARGAQGQGNAAIRAGSAQAAGTINQANALTGMLDTGLSNYFTWKSMPSSPYQNPYDQNAQLGRDWNNSYW